MTKQQIRTACKRAGRTRKWLHDTMKMPKSTFWHKVNHGTLTKEEIAQIKTLLK